MFYIILSNIGLAMMTLFIYFRYANILLKSKIEIEKIKKNYPSQDLNIQTPQKIADNDPSTNEALKNEISKNEILENKYKELEKEREAEIILRNNAEKQIDITNKKMSELEQRIEDWSAIQDAIMCDTRDYMIKIGNDLFKKLNEIYKKEVEANRKLIGNIEQKINEQKILLNNIVNVNNQQNTIIDNNNLIKKTTKVEIKNDQVIINFLEKVGEKMNLLKKIAKKDYFIRSIIEEKNAKSMLCELIFVSCDHFYLVDFKALAYFEEYERIFLNDNLKAQNFLKEKLEKYIAYLSNSKYLETISKVFGSIKFAKEKITIVLALPSKTEIEIMKNIQYYEKAKKLNIEVMNFDLIINIIT